jgi:hypothetical protein
MKAKVTLFTLLLCAAIGVKAQNLIVVQHAGTPKFYTKLPDAITGALAGDTVYMPGGGFDGITINKKLYLIGVGHNPDSTSVTARTMVSSIQLDAGSDGGLITGILSNLVVILNNVKNYTISRCNITSVGQIYPPSLATNFTFTENVISEFQLDNSTGLNVYNNVFIDFFRTPINSTIKNNLFLSVNSSVSAANCIFENNIFQQVGTCGGGNNVFYNNINTGINGTDGSANQGSGNFLGGFVLSFIFQSYNASIISTTDAVYKQNFNLPLNSPYKNAGRDGTDIGIYGGAFPWKAGSIPFNPHFQSLKIAPKTDSSGNLKVQITVAAQNN